MLVLNIWISASTQLPHGILQNRLIYISNQMQCFANYMMYKTNTLYSLVIFKQVSNYSIYNEEYVINLSIVHLNEEW